MKFEPVEFEGQIIGYLSYDSYTAYFFGTEAGTLERIQRRFPSFAFSRLRQVHGSLLVESAQGSDTPPPEADAHWTNTDNNALIVLTADCLPVLVSHPKFVCAIHAGWRGVDGEIVPKALSQLLDRHGFSADMKVTIGPHIASTSFEVDLALSERFRSHGAKVDAQEQIVLPHPTRPDKALVDLHRLVQCQAARIGLSRSQFFAYSADTLTDNRFASFRRQRENAPRNISFVVRTSSAC